MRPLLLFSALALSTSAFAQDGRLKICFSDGQAVRATPTGATDGTAVYALANGRLEAPVGRIESCGPTARQPSVKEGYHDVHLGASGSLVAIPKEGEDQTTLILLDGGTVTVEPAAITAVGPVVGTTLEPIEATSEEPLTICFSDGQTLQARPTAASEAVAAYQLSAGWLLAPVGQIRDCGPVPRQPAESEGYQHIHLGSSGSLKAIPRRHAKGTQLVLLDGGSVVVEVSAITARSSLFPSPPPEVPSAVDELRAQWRKEAPEVTSGGSGALIGMGIGAGMFGIGAGVAATGDISYQGFDGQVLVGGLIATSGALVFTGSFFAAIASGLSHPDG